MLLQHAWLAPFVKPATIVEEDEEAAEAEAGNAESKLTALADSHSPVDPSGMVFDKEVADWVKDAIEKRRKGTLGKGVPKPALHAAPLDAMPSPGQNGVNALDLKAEDG